MKAKLVEVEHCNWIHRASHVFFQDIERSLCRYVHIIYTDWEYFLLLFHHRRFFQCCESSIFSVVFLVSFPSMWKNKIKKHALCASFHLSHWKKRFFFSLFNSLFFKRKLLFWRRIKNNFCFNNANGFFIVWSCFHCADCWFFFLNKNKKASRRIYASNDSRFCTQKNIFVSFKKRSKLTAALAAKIMQRWMKKPASSRIAWCTFSPDRVSLFYFRCRSFGVVSLYSNNFA